MYDITVTPAEATESLFRDGAYTLSCTCGESVTYRGYWFTRVEAARHAQYHAGQDDAHAKFIARRDV